MKNTNIEDLFLHQARKEQISITVFLVNGFQFKGYVKGFDNDVLLLEYEGKQHLLYKHAISTIIPGKYITVLDAQEQN